MCDLRGVLEYILITEGYSIDILGYLDRVESLMQQICYQFGHVTHNLRTGFNNAVDHYIEAYVELSQNLKNYRQEWTWLDPNFYK